VISDGDRLPKSVTGIFVMAGALYVRRFALYITLAAVVLAVQYVVGVLLPHSDGLVAGLSIVVDAFFFAAVSIGVAFDLAEKEVDWSTILLAANERWGVVSIVCLAYWLVFVLLAPSVFDQPDDVASGLLILPIVVFWGAIQLGQVVASIEPVKTQLSLPFLAIGKGLAVSLRWINVGRLVLLSLVVVLPTVATDLLATVLTEHHVHDAAFWGSVPLDALTVGPIAALSTVFYVDFLRRART
jgi:hypothetical protein